MKLGTLDLANRYVLAPMQNVTTAPFRRFLRKFQEIGLVSVPMLYTKRIASNSNSIAHELSKIEDEKPISVQIIGRDLDALRKSIDYLESFNFDVLDINAGCPSRRAINAREGGYLMKDLKRLEEILQVAVKNSSKPVSLKIRTGFNKPMDFGDLYKTLNNSGITFLTVHARTVKSKFISNSLDLKTLRKLKELLTIPIVGNGDITSVLSAKNFIEQTDVDALMIGRETMGNPKIFHQIHEYLLHKKIVPLLHNLDLVEYYINIYEEIIDDFLTNLSLPNGNEKFKFNELRRNSIWLTNNVRDSTKIRTQLSKTKNLKQLKSKLRETFSSS